MENKSKDYVSAIKQALSGNQLVIGLSRVLNLIKTGNMTNVYYCGDCPQKVVEELNYYQTISGSFDLSKIPLSNTEFGTMCKKQFQVSVVGIQK